MCKPMLAVACALTMTGCASTTPPIVESSPPALPQSKTPQRLLEECPDWPEAYNGSRAEILENHVSAAKAYHACRERQRELAERVKKREEFHDY